MSWSDHLVQPGIVPSVDRVAEGGDLGEALVDLYHWQAGTWPRLGQSLRGLLSVRTRTLALGERDVAVQWNPGRETSTTAKVDTASLQARPCFLCPENLPPEEQGVPFGEHFVVLVNPAPITALHLVVSDRQHRPQELDGVLADAIAFTEAAGGRLTVFYNGPLCGASAPDHVHLQAVEAGSTMDERVVAGWIAHGWEGSTGRVLCDRPGLRAWCDTGSSRTLLVLHGLAAQVESGIRIAMDAMNDLLGSAREPPVNLLLTSTGKRITALMYPRGAHRPSCYFAEGEDLVLISPGALDMAGLVITVRRTDFERLDAVLMRQIYEETSPDPRFAEQLEIAVRRRLEHG